MYCSNIKTKRKYEVEDLPEFFKNRSKNISKVFSSKTTKISTIRSRSVDNNKQELSFKLKLLVAVDEDIPSTILPQIKHLIVFFKICLSQGKSFTVDIIVPKENKELCNNYYKANKTIEGFINSVPPQIPLQGITMTLQTNVKSIDLDSLHQIDSFLNEKLKRMEKTKSEEQSQDTLQAEKTESKDKKRKRAVQQENVQNKQIVQVKGSFGYDIKNRRQVARASIAAAAMCENVSWFRSFFRLPNFFNTVQFFSQQLPKFPIQSNNMPFGVIPALGAGIREEKEPASCTGITEDNIRNLVPQEAERDIGQTRSHTDYFKANRKKKSKKQAKALSEEEKQLAVRQAQNDARVAIIDNQVEYKGKKLDEIFVEVVNGYKNQDPETFHNIFNSVFNIVYFQDKRLHEILDPDEISRVLEILKISQPVGKSSFPKEYLHKQVYRKKEQLLKLVSDISIRPFPQPKNISHENGNSLPNKNPLPETNKTSPPTSIALKSPLKTVFSSKRTYFCLFLVAFSISMLCIWHLPLGKVSILKGLVPPEKRESVGLALNIGLPILATLCVLSLAYFIYSKYSVESIEQVGENKLLTFT